MKELKAIKDFLDAMGIGVMEALFNREQIMFLVTIIAITVLILFLAFKSGILWTLIKLLIKTFARMIKDSMK